MRVDEVIVVHDGPKSIVWLDIIDPTPLELEGITERYLLPAHAVQDCLDAEHLPKFERIGTMNFVIVRAYDEDATHDSDTVQELTRKIAIFETNGLVITLHRRDQAFFSRLKDEWRSHSEIGELLGTERILLDIVKASIESYEAPMLLNRNLLEDFESKVFKHQSEAFEESYYLKRRASTFKRMIRLTIDILPKIGDQYRDDKAFIQDLKEKSDRLYMYAEEFFENVTQLMNLYLSLSSHRLTMSSHRQNEVMRILTIFSVFFMPLNLITGIYGMNFENMPELRWSYGYYFALALISLISLAIASFFWAKGYFKREKID